METALCAGWVGGTRLCFLRPAAFAATIFAGHRAARRAHSSATGESRYRADRAAGHPAGTAASSSTQASAVAGHDQTLAPTAQARRGDIRPSEAALLSP